MAKVQLSVLVGDVRGQIGDLVFSERQGQARVNLAPAKSTKPRSPAQLARQALFQEASDYAQAVRQDAGLGAFYDARYAVPGQTNTWRGLVMQDYLNAPWVAALDLAGYHGQPGDGIGVEAHDDTGVVRVAVTIRAADGQVLETGEALRELSRWVYAAQASAPLGTCPQVTAVAYDRPGRTGEMTMALDAQGLPIGPRVQAAEDAEERGALAQPAGPEQPAAEEAVAVTESAVPEAAAAAEAPPVAAAVEAGPSATDIEWPAVVEDAPPAAPEPAWYWVPAWPVPTWTATALVAVPGGAAAETALPGLWSAPDYTGWPGEPESLPCEVEVQAAPVDTVMHVPVAAPQAAVPAEAVMHVPVAAAPPAAVVPAARQAPVRQRAGHAVHELAAHVAPASHVSIERAAHLPPVHAETHPPGQRAGVAEEMHAPADPVTRAAVPGTGTTPGCPARRQSDRADGLAQMRATSAPGPPPEKRG